MSHSRFYEPIYAFTGNFSVTLPEQIVLRNQPPIVTELIKSATVYAGIEQSQVVVVGTPLDMQLDPIYVSEWGFSSKPKDEVEDPVWVTFKNETIAEGLTFTFNPPPEAAGKEYSIFFILGDRNIFDPQEKEFKFTVTVKSLVVFTKEEVTVRKESKPKIVTVKVSQPDPAGFFEIDFSQSIKVLKNCTDWEWQNEGADKLMIEY